MTQAGANSIGKDRILYLIPAETPHQSKLDCQVDTYREIAAEVVNASFSSGVAEIKASRGFAGPSQFPPKNFKAYGLVVFRSSAAASDRDRHMMVCEAYQNTLPHFTALSTQQQEQMVTIWPIATDAKADLVNAIPKRDTCELAIDSYGLTYALSMLKSLDDTKAIFNSIGPGEIGPFLLAWAPSDKIGQPDTLVLASNLSAKQTYDEFVAEFTKWRDEIQLDPSLWDGGFEEMSVREKLRIFFDDIGAIFKVGG